MCSGGGGDGGAGQARADEAARQARIKQGQTEIDNQFSRFDDAFYKGRQDAYTNFAMPQVNDQYKQNSNQLAFSLARNGLSASSEAARQGGILQRDNAIARQTVSDSAIAEGQKSRQAVEDNRNNLINQLQATSDPTMAANNALRQAGILSQQANNFSPIGQLFQNTAGVLTAANQAGYYGGGPGLNAYKNYFGFGTPSSSYKVVGK